MKYVKRISVQYFLRDHSYRTGGFSIIWCSLLKTLPLIQESIAWDIGHGNQRWWLNFEELHLDGALAIEWDLYASRLAHAGVYISEQPDRLV